MKRLLEANEAHRVAVVAHHDAHHKANAVWKEWRALREAQKLDEADAKFAEHGEHAKAEQAALDAVNVAHAAMVAEDERRRTEGAAAWKERHARLQARSDEFATKRAADAADFASREGDF